MTPTITVLIFISAVFAAAAALRLLIRAALFLTYFIAELAGALRPEAHAPFLDLDFPTAR